MGKDTKVKIAQTCHCGHKFTEKFEFGKGQKVKCPRCGQLCLNVDVVEQKSLWTKLRIFLLLIKGYVYVPTEKEVEEVTKNSLK